MCSADVVAVLQSHVLLVCWLGVQMCVGQVLEALRHACPTLFSCPPPPLNK